MEWDRVVPKTRAEARKAEENGFLGDGMNEDALANVERVREKLNTKKK